MAEMLRPNVVEIKPESLPPSMGGSPTTATTTPASILSSANNSAPNRSNSLINPAVAVSDNDLNNTIITPPPPSNTTTTSLLQSSTPIGAPIIDASCSINQLVQDQQDLTIIPKLIPILPARSQCIYTECYCEENVWKLCDKIRTDHSTEIDYCQVAFISNPKRMVPLWRQKSGKNEEKLALWDYHVILLYNPDDRCVVYDMDSDLPFPTHFHRYVNETFRTENILQSEYHRFFRVIGVRKFLSLFSSDRSHMKKEDGTWLKPPPLYPQIYTSGINNLQQFLDMTPGKNEYGEVLNLTELVKRYFKPRQLS